MSELIIHVWLEYNGTYRIESNEDEVLADGFDSADAAYEYACKMYSKATVYQYGIG